MTIDNGKMHDFDDLLSAWIEQLPPMSDSHVPAGPGGGVPPLWNWATAVWFHGMAQELLVQTCVPVLYMNPRIGVQNIHRFHNSREDSPFISNRSGKHDRRQRCSSVSSK